MPPKKVDTVVIPVKSFAETVHEANEAKKKEKKPDPTILKIYKNIKGHAELGTEFSSSMFPNVSCSTKISAELMKICVSLIKNQIFPVFGSDGHFNEKEFYTLQDLEKPVSNKKSSSAAKKKIEIKRMPKRKGDELSPENPSQEIEVDAEDDADAEVEDEVDAEDDAEEEPEPEEEKKTVPKRKGREEKKKHINIHKYAKYGLIQFISSRTLMELYSSVTPSKESAADINNHDFYIKQASKIFKNGSLLVLIMKVMKVKGNDDVYDTFDLDNVLNNVFHTGFVETKYKTAYHSYTKFVSKILAGFYKILLMDIITNLYVKKAVTINVDFVKIALKNTINALDINLLGSETDDKGNVKVNNLMRDLSAYINLTDVECFAQQKIRNAAIIETKNKALSKLDTKVETKVVVTKKPKAVAKPKKKVQLEKDDSDDLDGMTASVEDD